MARTANTTEIDHSDEPVRLFKSDFLEFFTHISPVVVLIVWAPVAVFFLLRAVLARGPGEPWLHIPAGFLMGLFLWTLAEYAIHRFVFHYDPQSERLQEIWFLFHGVHHLQPQLKTRLVMPPVVSIPLALLFYGLFHLVLAVLLGASAWVAPVFSGFISGYLAYDMVHYATHHFPMRAGHLKQLKRYHMMHHFKTPTARFGVSSSLWDRVFGTLPGEGAR